MGKELWPLLWQSAAKEGRKRFAETANAPWRSLYGVHSYELILHAQASFSCTHDFIPCPIPRMVYVTPCSSRTVPDINLSAAQGLTAQVADWSVAAAPH